jgi:hypothetical protein
MHAMASQIAGMDLMRVRFYVRTEHAGQMNFSVQVIDNAYLNDGFVMEI